MSGSETKRLYRSRTDRQLTGVCGGLGAYLGIDSTLIRIAFIASLFGGPGVLLYLILALVVPDEPTIA